MNQGPSQCELDNEKFSLIESEIERLITQTNPEYSKIHEIIPNLETLRLKGKSGQTPLWMLARHSDIHPALLMNIIKVMGKSITLDDLQVKAENGFFKDKTVRWLLETVPIDEHDFFNQFMVDVMINSGLKTRTFIPRKESYVLTQMEFDFGLKRVTFDIENLASDFQRGLKIKS